MAKQPSWNMNEVSDMFSNDVGMYEDAITAYKKSGGNVKKAARYLQALGYSGSGAGGVKYSLCALEYAITNVTK